MIEMQPNSEGAATAAPGANRFIEFMMARAARALEKDIGQMRELLANGDSLGAYATAMNTLTKSHADWGGDFAAMLICQYTAALDIIVQLEQRVGR